MSIERPAVYVVATPIGNLSDLSPRAIDTLRGVDLILCEDTRTTGRLLAANRIDTPTRAVHDHNEAQLAGRLIERLANERLAYALTSDAGTPLISDPGYRLLQAAHSAGVPVRVIPGPSAPIAALSVSGVATDRFCFEGFLPAKSAARRQRLAALAYETRSMVFLESCHRIGAALDDMVDAFGGDRPAAIAREMTKLHEQVVHARLSQLASRLASGAIPARGEFVVVVGGGSEADDSALAARLMTELIKHLPVKAAAKAVAAVTGGRPNELYDLAQKLKPGRDREA